MKTASCLNQTGLFRRAGVHDLNFVREEGQSGDLREPECDDAFHGDSDLINGYFPQ